MRAVVFEKFGEPSEVLDVQAVDDMTPGHGQVRVRMLASPVNPSDLMTIRGIYGRLPELPATPGFEGVGIVEQSGGGLIGSFMKGKRVAVLNRDRGNWCEHTVVPARQVIPLDKSLSLEQAAMFFVNPASAWIMTREVLGVPNGEWLLQTAAGSSLGRMVIRLGKQCGFRTLNVVRRKEQADELSALGADAVVAFNPEHDDAGNFASQVRDTVGGGVGFAIDPVGGATGSAVIPCLGPNGRMLCYGTLSNQPLSFSPRSLMTVGSAVEGFWLSNYMDSLRLIGKLKLVRTISGLIRDGILTSEVGESFPLDSVRDAVQKAEQPGRGGKVLLRIADA